MTFDLQTELKGKEKHYCCNHRVIIWQIIAVGAVVVALWASAA